MEDGDASAEDEVKTLAREASAVQEPSRKKAAANSKSDLPSGSGAGSRRQFRCCSGSVWTVGCGHRNYPLVSLRELYSLRLCDNVRQCLCGIAQLVMALFRACPCFLAQVHQNLHDNFVWDAFLRQTQLVTRGTHGHDE